MGIDRTWWNNLVDDSGSGTTGTVWNKAAIKGLLDAIDAMFTHAQWDPADGSGAGLVFTKLAPCMYSRIGPFAWVAFDIRWPSTANGSAAVIYGIPFPSTYHVAGSAIAYTNFGDYLTLAPVDGAYTCGIWSKTGVQVTNAQLSGKEINGFVLYLAEP